MAIAYIGMGANIPGPAGSPEATLARAAEQISALGRLGKRSSLYRTEPVGYAEQPEFTNAVLALETELEPRALLEALLGIERGLGRDRAGAVVNGPRPLDLDILLVDGLRVCSPGLEIPHPRLTRRAFVLVPLNEIAPLLVVPGFDETVAGLLDRLLAHTPGEAHAVVRIESEVWSAAGGAASASWRS